MRSIALIDVNNFYASCERVFNPKLEGKAVVILSNNDGCVIARNAVTKALGICVGVGASKTLAKLANHVAKKRPEYNGVCNLNQFEPEQLNKLLGEIPIGEVWGIGRKLVPRLNAYGIQTVLELKASDPEYMRQQFSVVMEKTVRELNGQACMELEEVASPKQQILSSRSFGRPVTDIESLSESVTLYISRAAEKLRKQKSYASALSVYIRTSPFSDEPKYSNTRTVSLPSPTDDSRQLVSVGLWILKGIYKSGFKYQKAGIMLSNIVPAEGQQTDLFGFKQSVSKSDKLMAVMDEINRKMGNQRLRVASQGYKQPWAMKQEMKSQRFTTKWDEILSAR